MEILKETKEFLTNKGIITLEKGDKIEILKEDAASDI